MLLQKNIPLKKHSNYKIGGPATHFYEFKSKEDLLLALSEFKALNTDGEIFILGGGTNILFPDKGFDGLVLKNKIDFINREGLNLSVGGGTLIEELIKFCTQNSLSGFEWAGGLPGTVGGAIRGNAGAFLGEAGDSVLEVESLDLKTLKTVVRSKEECKFGYRKSVFKSEGEAREVIMSAKFKLRSGNQAEIKKSTQEKNDYRIDRHPLDMPNIGSIFKNFPVKDAPEQTVSEFKDSIKKDPFPVIPAAKLIIGVGLMGEVKGGAMVSKKHPNFIVNVNGAKASDVLGLIDLVKEKVKEKYNVTLDAEIMVL